MRNVISLAGMRDRMSSTRTWVGTSNDGGRAPADDDDDDDDAEPEAAAAGDVPADSMELGEGIELDAAAGGPGGVALLRRRPLAARAASSCPASPLELEPGACWGPDPRDSVRCTTEVSPSGEIWGGSGLPCGGDIGSPESSAMKSWSRIDDLLAPGSREIRPRCKRPALSRQNSRRGRPQRLGLRTASSPASSNPTVDRGHGHRPNLRHASADPEPMTSRRDLGDRRSSLPFWVQTTLAHVRIDRPRSGRLGLAMNSGSPKRL